MAVLLSPVASIHHLHWMVVVIFAILGADPLRDRRRLVGGRSSPLVPLLLPVGHLVAEPPRVAGALGRVLQNADTFGALLALALLAWSLSRTIPRAHPHHHPHLTRAPIRTCPHPGLCPDRNPRTALPADDKHHHRSRSPRSARLLRRAA